MTNPALQRLIDAAREAAAIEAPLPHATAATIKVAPDARSYRADQVTLHLANGTNHTTDWTDTADFAEALTTYADRQRHPLPNRLHLRLTPTPATGASTHTCRRCRTPITWFKGLWWSNDDDFMCPSGDSMHVEGPQLTSTEQLHKDEVRGTIGLADWFSGEQLPRLVEALAALSDAAWPRLSALSDDSRDLAAAAITAAAELDQDEYSESVSCKPLPAPPGVPALPQGVAAYLTNHDLDGVIRTVAELADGADPAEHLSTRQMQLAATCRVLVAARAGGYLPELPQSPRPGRAAPKASQEAAQELYSALLHEVDGWADDSIDEADFGLATEVLAPALVLSLLAALPVPLVPGVLASAVAAALEVLDPANFAG